MPVKPLWVGTGKIDTEGKKDRIVFKKKDKSLKSLSGKNYMHALKFRLSGPISFWVLTAHSIQSFCPLIFTKLSISFPQLSHFPIYSPSNGFRVHM